MSNVLVLWKCIALITPLVVVYLTWVRCPLQRENTPVYKALVSPDVVSIVMCALGLAFCRALETSRLNLIYECLILLLICSWIGVYSHACGGAQHNAHSMKLSILFLILSLLLISIVSVTTNDVIHRMCLVPVAIWIMLVLTYQTQRKALGTSNGECALGMCDTIA